MLTTIIPSANGARKVREDVIQMQQWLSQFSDDDERVKSLRMHLNHVRQDLEHLM